MGSISKDKDEKKERDIVSTAETISKAFQDKEFVKKTSSILKKSCDGEPKNTNPLTEIPEPQMRLYGFSGVFNSAYFDTKEELNEWVKNHNTDFGDICVIDYLGKVAGRNDVIRKTYRDGKSKLYAVCDNYGYGIYNFKRSIYRGEFVWEYNYGSLREMYSAFRDRGISFDNDIYDKIDKKYQKILELCREKKN
ncbi:MAG: hypothetical protein VZS44_00730 [Bacilli bacterium]|nr:hypothetical protein [Bacilli bacterium]